MRKMWSPVLALLWLIADVALSQSTPVQSTLPTPIPESVFFRWHGCDDKIPGSSQTKQSFINDAWDEFEAMVPYELDTRPLIQTYKYPWIDYTSAPWIEFFGPALHGDAMTRVEENIHRLASTRWGFLTFWGIDLRCDDPAARCPEDPGDPCEPGYKPPSGSSVIAYTMHGGNYENHINFCPAFFRRPKLVSQVDLAAGSEGYRDMLDNYRNRAFTIAHELLHVTWIGKTIDYPVPGIDFLDDISIWANSDEGAYRTQDTKYLALSDFAFNYGAVNNVQNYAHYLLAQYVINKKNFYPSSVVWRTDQYNPPDKP